MKSTIRHGATLRCDMVTISEDGTKYADECQTPAFISYSVSSMIREQAEGRGWLRPTVSRVKWPGEPPMAGAKKVDICPEHAHLVISKEEAEKIRAEARAKAKADKLAAREAAKIEKKRQREAAREVAREVKAQKKARRKRGGAAGVEA